MNKRFEVNIPVSTLVLEGVVELPERGAGPFPLCVICHPHPLYGGNMHNNVVRALKHAMHERGTATLRFNFRGTGKSWGSYGEGIGELDDVKAALDFVETLEQVDRARLMIAGYSFGCWVGLRAVSEDTRVRLLIGISPPCNEYDFSFLTQEFRPKFLVVGDGDFVCATDKFDELMAKLPEPKTGPVLAGIDHFHVGTERRFIDELNTFLDRHPF